MLVRSENRWLYRDVTRQTKNCSVWSAFELVLPLWWWPAHLSRDNSVGSATVTARNPGSFYDTYLVPAVTRGQRIMQRAFFCLGACVRAFQCCLPMVCIDGTFLTGRYKGQILTAIGVDCNNQIVKKTMLLFYKYGFEMTDVITTEWELP